MSSFPLATLKQAQGQQHRWRDRKVDQYPVKCVQLVAGAPQLIDGGGDGRGTAGRIADQHTGRAILAQRAGERQYDARENPLPAGRQTDTPEYVTIGETKRLPSLR